MQKFVYLQKISKCLLFKVDGKAVRKSCSKNHFIQRESVLQIWQVPCYQSNDTKIGKRTLMLKKQELLLPPQICEVMKPMFIFEREILN